MGLDAALRENLSMGLMDGLDAAVISGTNGLLTGTTLGNHNVTTQTTYALYRDQLAYGRVDGRFASGYRGYQALYGSRGLWTRGLDVQGQQRQHGRTDGFEAGDFRREG